MRRMFSVLVAPVAILGSSGHKAASPTSTPLVSVARCLDPPTPGRDFFDEASPSGRSPSAGTSSVSSSSHSLRFRPVRLRWPGSGSTAWSRSGRDRRVVRAFRHRGTASTARSATHRLRVRRARELHNGPKLDCSRNRISTSPERRRNRLDRGHGRGHVQPCRPKVTNGPRTRQSGPHHRRARHVYRRLLAASVLIGLTFNATTGAWWADPLGGFVIVFYGLKEAHAMFTANG